jgi:PBS lyase HEAT-like repeat
MQSATGRFARPLACGRTLHKVLFVRPMGTSSPALRVLETAVAKRDAAAMWTAVPAVEKCLDAVPILAEQLLADWHECHEDIVFTLGLMRDPRAIDAISKAILIQFDCLIKWNNLHEFQRKCAYALARIGTEESRAALTALARHSDTHLQEYAKEGLEHWVLHKD